MDNIFLTKPDKKYQKSFESYVSAYKNSNDTYYYNKYKKALDNFAEYLNYLNNFSNGINLPKGEVATTTYWLICNEEVAGVTRIRHHDVICDGNIGYDISPAYRQKGLGTQILKLALEKAAIIGLKDAFATCSVSNIASKKIIENNNGKLLGTVFDEEENDNLYRYTIHISEHN